MPRLSILLPAYNGEAFIVDAIQSIISQTFPDYELIVLDDGSPDNIPRAMAKVADRRVRYKRNERNLGISLTLNRGMQMSDSEFIGRMDQDDIALPNRFARQIAFADANRAVACCGTWMREFGRGRRTVLRLPRDNERLNAALCFDSPIFHPTVLMRRQFLYDNNLQYAEDAVYAEDYDLWERVAQHGELANLNEILLLYRMHEGQTSNLRRIWQMQTAATVRSRALLRLGILEEKDLQDFNKLCGPSEQLTGADLDSLLEVAIGAVSRARTRNDAFSAEFTRCLIERWILACIRSGGATTMVRAMLKGLARVGLGPTGRSLLDSYRIRRGGIFSLLKDRLAG